MQRVRAEQAHKVRVLMVRAAHLSISHTSKCLVNRPTEEGLKALGDHYAVVVMILLLGTASA